MSRGVKLSATPLKIRDFIWCSVIKALPGMKIQFVEFPLDVILWGIRDVFPLLEILPRKPLGVLSLVPCVHGCCGAGK